jgi:hypothetical protein
MVRTLAVLSAALLGLTAAADDKKPKKEAPKHIATWEKEADGLTISFAFKTATEGKCVVDAGGAGLVLTLKYELKDDKVSAEVTKVEEKGEFPAKVPVGYKMKFTLKIDGADNADEARAVVEGEYKKKKAD